MSDLIFFNVADGYAEAILRGLRKSFLGETTYSAIRNVNSLKDLKSVYIII
jgi:V-type H+-transporting ATPase subunit d